MARIAYSTDPANRQWALIASHLPPLRHGGRPRETVLRAVVDAALFLLRIGCQWRLLPRNFLALGYGLVALPAVSDRRAARFLTDRLSSLWPTIHTVIADAAYESKGLSQDLKDRNGWKLLIV